MPQQTRALILVTQFAIILGGCLEDPGKPNCSDLLFPVQLEVRLSQGTPTHAELFPKKEPRILHTDPSCGTDKSIKWNFGNSAVSTALGGPHAYGEFRIYSPHGLIRLELDANIEAEGHFFVDLETESPAVLWNGSSIPVSRAESFSNVDALKPFLLNRAETITERNETHHIQVNSTWNQGFALGAIVDRAKDSELSATALMEFKVVAPNGTVIWTKKLEPNGLHVRFVFHPDAVGKWAVTETYIGPNPPPYLSYSFGLVFVY